MRLLVLNQVPDSKVQPGEKLNVPDRAALQDASQISNIWLLDLDSGQFNLRGKTWTYGLPYQTDIATGTR